MPTLAVSHLTRYRYRKPVAFGEHRLMLRPFEGPDQSVLDYRLAVSPTPSVTRQQQDVFGNTVSFVRFASRADELTFESRFRVRHTPAEIDLTQDADRLGQGFPFVYPVGEAPDLQRCIERRYPDPDRALEGWVRRFVRWNGRTPVMALLAEMTRSIRGDFRYEVRLEGAPRLPHETLEEGAGACRDFALLMMEAARTLGLAARFVSGYIHSPGGQTKSDGAKGEGKLGGGHTHAWVQVYLPASGWVDFDPTNGLIGGRDLIRVAVARDPSQVAPLTGTWEGDATDALGMDVEVSVEVEPRTPELPARAA